MKRLLAAGGIFLAVLVLVQNVQAATISGKILDEKGALVQTEGMRIDTCLGTPRIIGIAGGSFSFAIRDMDPFCVILIHPSLQPQAIRAANARISGSSYRYQIAAKDCAGSMQYPCGPLRRGNDLIRDDAYNFVLSDITSGSSPNVDPVPSVPVAPPPVVPVQDGLQVSLDPSASTAEQWVIAGQTNVAAATLLLTAGSESLQLQSLGLVVESAAAVNPLSRVSVWDGGVQIGSATFMSSKSIEVPFIYSLLLPAHTAKKLTIRADISGVSTGSATKSGEWFSVNYDASKPERTTAIRQYTAEQRQSVTKTIASTPKLYYFRSLPHVLKMELPASDLKSDLQVIYKFRIEPDQANKISLGKMSFEVATTNVTAFAKAPANFELYDVTAKKRVAVATGTSAEYYQDPNRYTQDGKLIVSIPVDTTDRLNPVIVLDLGDSHVFELRASVHDLGNGSVSTRILGDTAPPKLATLMGTLEEVKGSSNNNFVWSDHSADLGGQHSLITQDWTNGYSIPGLTSTDNTPATLTLGPRTSQYWASILTSLKEQLEALTRKIKGS